MSVPATRGFFYSISGGTVTADTNDPNTTAPTTTALLSRVYTVPVQGNSSVSYRGVCTISVQNGTSLIIEPWFWDESTSKWFKMGSYTCAAGTPQVFDAPAGVKMFLRIAANNGTVTTWAAMCY